LTHTVVYEGGKCQKNTQQNSTTMSQCTLPITQASAYLSSSAVALRINSGNPIISTTASACIAETKTQHEETYGTTKSK